MGVTEECGGRGMGRQSRGPVHDFSVRAPKKEGGEMVFYNVDRRMHALCQMHNDYSHH